MALLWGPNSTASAPYEQSGVTIGGAEHSLVTNSIVIASIATPACASVMIESTAMRAGDQFEIALIEKIIAGGPQRRVVIGQMVGLQDEPTVTPPLNILNGWDFTLTKLLGTDRAFTWSIRVVTP